MNSNRFSNQFNIYIFYLLGVYSRIEYYVDNKIGKKFGGLTGYRLISRDLNENCFV